MSADESPLVGEREPTLAEALALLDEFLGKVPGCHADMLADALAYRTSPTQSGEAL